VRLKRAVITPFLDCAVLSIDLRGSTKEAGRRGGNPTEEARKIEKLLEVFESLTRKCTADFVKSTGDGLMSFWHLDGKRSKDRTDLLIEIAKAAMRLNEDLADQLKRKLPSIRRLPVGLGLAIGPVTKLRNEKLEDYFGFHASLAAKLQDLARPGGGLVIQREFAEQVPDLSRGLISHTVLDGSALSNYIDVDSYCYSTANVKWLTDWTCLAWSGFATPGIRTDEPVPDHYKFGLNNIGLTVLTHEGLQGKIGTLEIWQRAVPQRCGDPFELIIDDFDALAAMCHSRGLKLKEAGIAEGKSREILGKICRPLVEDERCERFLFIPVRCGINGLIWNRNSQRESPAKRYYSELGSKLRKGKIASKRVGFYDNLGATLPLLIMMMTVKHISLANLYEYDWKKPLARGRRRPLDAIRGDLKRIVKSYGKFKLYSKAKSLSEALYARDIDIAVGGGAWLMEQKNSTKKNALVSKFPSCDGGLLCVEGAAVTGRAADRHLPDILSLLSGHVLARGYQDSLATREPYSSSPVTVDAVGAILKGKKLLPVNEETGLIYKNTQTKNSKLVHRRRPDQIALWVDAWNRIVDDCCIRMDGIGSGSEQ